MDFKINKFSGPLSLLLTLIEDQEMDITDISLAHIADEYVSYVKRAENINPEELADFLVVAAKLLLIKSRALLPYLSSVEEEESNNLAQQLHMYKEFVAASLKIKELIASKHHLFLPPLIKNRPTKFNLPSFRAPAKIKASTLQEQFLKILSELSQREENVLLETQLEAKINIEEKVLLIKQMLKTEARFNFSSLLSKLATKNEIIVNFLAVLELVKQEKLIFEQIELFSEINILRPN